MDNYRPKNSEDAISVAKQVIWEKFGISFSTVENGTACGELTLNPRYLNFYGVPFGGILFNLADNTAGMAFLSAGGNGVTVLSKNQVAGCFLSMQKYQMSSEISFRSILLYLPTLQKNRENKHHHADF